MKALKLPILALVILSSSLLGCQMGYIVSSGYNQMKLLNARVPIEKALQDPTLSETDKSKLQLAQKARAFAEQDLHLKPTKNYTSFVKLDRPYVTYVVSAAPKWELKHYNWSYPFLGKMPYKGFFNEADAKAEAEELKKEDLDTYVRGVSAYSTLGWFKDPLLSSMLTYKNHDLVNTVIHETVHATLYIKHEADFNERLAVFLGNKGTEMFYLKEEGPDSPTLKEIQKENQDDKIFSAFITKEIKSLEDWYKNLPQAEHSEEKRQARINEIQEHFKTEVLPKMQTQSYAKFPTFQLNNARLLVYKTYMQDLSDFEKLYEKVGKDFSKFIEECKKLEGSKNPAQDLKKMI